MTPHLQFRLISEGAWKIPLYARSRTVLVTLCGDAGAEGFRRLLAVAEARGDSYVEAAWVEGRDLFCCLAREQEEEALEDQEARWGTVSLEEVVVRALRGRRR